MADRQASSTSSRGRQYIFGLLRQAIPNNPDKQTSIEHIPPKYAQDTIDAAWKMLDNNAAAPRIHSALTLNIQATLLRRLCLKIAVVHDVLPSSFYISGVVCLSAEATDSGTYSDLYRGRYKGLLVVLKRPRLSSDDHSDSYKKEFCRESLLWSKLSHRHVLPLVGITQDTFPRSVCIVLPFMQRGNIRTRILGKNEPAHLKVTEANFKSYVDGWLSEIAAGIAYLHDQGVVHGNLHSGNILIDDDDRVRLTDFGFALIAEATANAYGSKHSGSAPHFVAPELWEPSEFDLDRARPTPASDVYAFACVCIELYTGRLPFAETKLTLYRISKKVLRGERPQRPATVSDLLWEVIEASWAHQPNERLTADELARRMEKITATQPVVKHRDDDEQYGPGGSSSSRADEKRRDDSSVPFSSTNGRDLQRGVIGHIYQAILGGFKNDEDLSIPYIPEEDAQRTINYAWESLDKPNMTIHPSVPPDAHSRLMRMLCLKLSTTYDLLPTSFYLEKVVRVGAEPFDTTGSCADIFRGRYQDAKVVLKRPRAQQNSEMMSQPLKHFCRESLLWKRLDHAHVLPFLGIAKDICGPICMVLPYMQNGAIRRRIRVQEQQRTRISFEDRVNRALYETALGLEYLHGQGVVHGDLHCGNILMDDEDHVRITDFGFALIAEATPGHFGSVHGGAAIHFTAPELFDAADFGLDNTRPTVATDVYALACTCVELYGDKWPWEGTEKLNNFQIGNKVSKGQRPKRPTTPYGEPMPASIWDVVCACWKQRPSDRLKVSPLVKQLEAIAFA